MPGRPRDEFVRACVPEMAMRFPRLTGLAADVTQMHDRSGWTVRVQWARADGVSIGYSQDVDDTELMYAMGGALPGFWHDRLFDMCRRLEQDRLEQESVAFEDRWRGARMVGQVVPARWMPDTRTLPDNAPAVTDLPRRAIDLE